MVYCAGFFYQLIHILIYCLVLAQTQTNQRQKQSGQSQNVVSLRTKGPSNVNISVKSGRTGGSHGVLETTNVDLWCQAVNSHNLEILPIVEVYFEHNGQRRNATLSEDRLKATLVLDQAIASDAGVWRCRAFTKLGNTSGFFSVFLRPVVLSNSSLRIDDVGKTKFHFEASGITVVRGDDARLECPVIGFPKPTIVWKKEGQDMRDTRISVENDGDLVIRNVTDSDDAKYSCRATNTIPSEKGKERKQHSITVDRRIRVKSEYAWLLPLFIILLTVILLATIIVLCELRKKRREQKLLDRSTIEEE